MKANVIVHGAITKDPRFPGNDPDDKKYKRKLLAEGDSWFSMGSIPVENLLLALEFETPAIVVNIAEPGDEIVKMADPRRVKLFQRLVGPGQFAYSWTAILLSGGGNDLIDQAPDILRSGNTVAACINQTQLRQCMSSIAGAYRALAAIRDQSTKNAQCPMIVHTYDFPTPRNAPALFFGHKIVGPWLYDDFVAKAIPEALWNPITDQLIDTLATTIMGLASGAKAIPGFHVIDTRKTIVRAEPGTKKKSGDWRNEIHPDRGGYKKLAAKLRAAIP
ncbi:MAG: hypothetical protein ACKVQA_25315 [Burkholderiales bacterium]